MADKVYGICGTNKCKREVIEKVIVTGSTTESEYSMGAGVYSMTVTLPYPDEYTVGNCTALATRVKLKLSTGIYHYYDAPYTVSDGSLYVNVQNTYTDNGIKVILTTTAPSYVEMTATALLARHS